MSDSILDEYGYGIYAITNSGSMDLYHETVVIDLVNKTVDGTPFPEFIEQAFLAEQDRGRVIPV
jgi:hypothetical protein